MKRTRNESSILKMKNSITRSNNFKKIAQPKFVTQTRYF